MYYLDFNPLQTLSYNKCKLSVDAYEMIVSKVNDVLLRVQIAADDTKPSYDLLQDPNIEVLQANVVNDEVCEFQFNAKQKIRFYNESLSFEIWQDETMICQSITDLHFQHKTRLPAFAKNNDSFLFSMALNYDEAIYGLGEKFQSLNKRGQTCLSFVQDALGVNTDLSYKNTPFIYSDRGWGLLFHTTCNIQHHIGDPQVSHRSYVACIQEPELDIFITLGDPKTMLQNISQLIAKPSLVPLYSLGFWWSKAYYKDENEILDTAKRIRNDGFGADVITFDGRAYLDTDTRFHFEFDSSRYHHPQSTIAQLKALGFKICCWEYPLVSIHNKDFQNLQDKGYFLRNQDGETYIYHWDIDAKTTPFGKVLTPLPPSAIIDFTNPKAYEYWRDQHQSLFDLGVDVIKSDFGEQVPFDCIAYNGDSGTRLHNVYPMLYNRCVYEATAKFKGKDKALVFSRSGWIGSASYPIGWGGDNQTDFEGLAASIRGGLSNAMSAGSLYYAWDIGGFYGDELADKTFYLRSLQAAIFSSHCRIHGIGKREPWHYDETITKIARQNIELRYQLIGYIMGVCQQSVQTRLPTMRALSLEYPQDKLCRSFDTQFMLGDSLLIAPVLNHQNDIEVYLPQGLWYDFFSQESFVGGKVYKLQTTLEHIPVFVKAGHTIVLNKTIYNTDELQNDADYIAKIKIFDKPIKAPTIFNNIVKFENQKFIFDSKIDDVIIESTVAYKFDHYKIAFD